jgi:site-specific DNA recombinase
MYVSRGMSLSAIAKSLNMQKIPSKKGSIWRAVGIRAVLTNCNYVGNVRYCNHDPERHFITEGKHEAIITEELYNAAQILLNKNARVTKTKRPIERNFFVNFLFCDECGSKFYSHTTNYVIKGGKAVNNSFICHKRVLKAGCNSKIITAGKIENALIDYFDRYEEVFTTDNEEAAQLDKQKKKNDTEIQGYKDKLRVFDNREKEVMRRYLNAEIDFDSYRNMKKQLDNDREFIRAELAKITVDVDENENQPTTINREEVAISFKENWQGLTDPEKRLFLTNYIKKIIVRNEPIPGSRYGNTKITGVEFNNF